MSESRQNGEAETRRALVVGPGAVGLAVAAALTERGFAVGFHGRRGPVGVAARLTRPGDDLRLSWPAPAPAFARSAQIVFVAVKAFDLAAALATLDLQRGATVVPLANGAVWDLVSAAAVKRPDLIWRLGFSTLGVSEVGERHYAVRARVGEISLGPLDDLPPTAAEAALWAPSTAPTSFGWHDNIRLLQRRKWIYNTVINTLTAARRLARNGDLLADLPMVAAVFTEALSLAVDLWGDLPPAWSAPALYEGLLQLIERTADNENSMARDRRLGKLTESAFLAGLATDKRRWPLLTQLHRQITASA